MLMIPAIDIKNGQCVRLRQGKMDEVSVFSDDPVAMAQQWISEGARRLHLVDLDGAVQGQPVNAALVKAIAKACPECPIQIGGGIRCLETIQAYLDAGVEYVIIGTWAVQDPDAIKSVCRRFPDQIIVGIDAKEGRVATQGWEALSDVDAIALAHQFESVGVAAIVYTDIARDGMMQGVNVEATAALAKAVSIPIIASGGMTHLEDIRKLASVADSGVQGAILGRALYEGAMNLSEAQALADQLSVGI